MTRLQPSGVLPDPREQPLSPLSVLQEVGLGGRSTIYDLAKRDALPVEVVRCGHLYRVRTVDVYRLVGLPVPGEAGGDAA
jgi:hypothetical protein